MPVPKWISPNKRISPFCVDIHDRFGWARLWLGKRSACKERPFCTISTTSLRQHSDTVHWSTSTRGCGCASWEHSWQHCGEVSEWFMQKTEPLLKIGAHFGQLRHSLRGSVTLKAQQKGCVCLWEPSDDLPHVCKQHSPAFESGSTFLLQCSVTRQDDV